MSEGYGTGCSQTDSIAVDCTWSENQLRAAATELYTPIKKWQTRILRLHRGTSDEVPRADLLKAGLANDDSLVIGMDEEKVTYCAVSYAWGKWSPAVPIMCNGVNYRVNPSLAGALKRFRHEDRDRYLWADALCINQFDVSEKSSQVRNMFNIFRKAEAVLVWLGGATPNATLALQEVHASSTKGSATVPSDKLVAGMQDLCSRPWLSRAWIQQEVFAARDLVLHCGMHSFTLDDYKAMGRRLEGIIGIQIDTTNADERPVQYDLQALAALKRGGVDELCELDQSRSQVHRLYMGSESLGSGRVRNENVAQDLRRNVALFEDVLGRGRFLGASDPRDLVYALLGLTNCSAAVESSPGLRSVDTLTLPIDYSKTPSEVFQDVTKYIVKRDGNLSILLNHRPASHGRLQEPLPSWTIDWTVPNYRYIRGAGGRRGDFDLQEGGILGTVVLCGIVIATIVTITPMQDQCFEREGWLLRLLRYAKAFWEAEEVLYEPNGEEVVARSYREYLHLLRPVDFAVLVDGAKHPIFLRPHDNGRFSFVCMGDHGFEKMYLEGMPSSWASKELTRLSISRICESGRDYRRAFTVI